ncbi:MAG: TetR family transcriptional regulator [Bacteroidales bacterium]|nr:TetR family transcriptional regulator [Bacteroidales bacterium]
MNITVLNTEQKIFYAAKKTFLRFGFHGTSLQQIALVAEVNKSLVHYYFRTKEKLYLQVLENVVSCIEEVDFTTENIQAKNIEIKWFLFTEMYNNQKLFEETLKELYMSDWLIKLNRIKNMLEI